jgi:hypothetical protein
VVVLDFGGGFDLAEQMVSFLVGERYHFPPVIEPHEDIRTRPQIVPFKRRLKDDENIRVGD